MRMWSLLLMMSPPPLMRRNLLPTTKSLAMRRLPMMPLLTMMAHLRTLGMTWGTIWTSISSSNNFHLDYHVLMMPAAVL